jgi:hypothetical protein
MSRLILDIDSFCKSEVEPMGKECEQIQVTALSEYLQIAIEIAYLDGRYLLITISIIIIINMIIIMTVTIIMTMIIMRIRLI